MSEIRQRIVKVEGSQPEVIFVNAPASPSQIIAVSNIANSGSADASSSMQTIALDTSPSSGSLPVSLPNIMVRAHCCQAFCT